MFLLLMKKKIIKEMLIGDAVRSNPKVFVTLVKHGLSCAGCPMAASETIEQGALAHGMKKKELSKLLKELNRD